MICCRDSRTKDMIRKHKKSSVVHYKELREFVHKYKDDEKTLGLCDIQVWKVEGRKPALHVQEYIFVEDEENGDLKYIYSNTTFNDLICYCDYCVNAKYDLCDDQDIP
jgi:hypothetical protein